MENRSVQLSNSNFSGNLVQGNFQGYVEANIESGDRSESKSETFKTDLRGATIGNYANKVSDNARQQANQYNYSSHNEKTLAESAKTIQKLIQQFKEYKPNATHGETVAHVNDETTPGFKRRVVGALKAAGETAIEEVLDNPYVNITKDCIKGWMNPG